jgi:hypothetical protein
VLLVTELMLLEASALWMMRASSCCICNWRNSAQPSLLLPLPADDRWIREVPLPMLWSSAIRARTSSVPSTVTVSFAVGANAEPPLRGDSGGVQGPEAIRPDSLRYLLWQLLLLLLPPAGEGFQHSSGLCHSHKCYRAS